MTSTEKRDLVFMVRKKVGKQLNREYLTLFYGLFHVTNLSYVYLEDLIWFMPKGKPPVYYYQHIEYEVMKNPFKKEEMEVFRLDKERNVGDMVFDVIEKMKFNFTTKGE